MSYIKSDFIEKVKYRADIKEVFETLGHELKKKGINYFCKSPFNDENTPSCCVDLTRQRYKDFSSGNSGDVVTILMETKGFTYPEAIKWLADHYSMEIQYEDEQKAKKAKIKQQEKEDLRPILLSAHKHYQNAFRDLPEDHPAKKEILEHREYNEEEIVDWGIGFAPGGTFIRDQMKGDATLIKKAEDLFLIGEKYDKYWSRITYPIHDKNGLLIGFAGRDVSGKKDSAKWLNPTLTPLYNKDKTWYALHRAAKSIRKKNEAWILEGYNDVIAWHRFGILNSIAGCGTSITPGQIRELKKYTNNVILCLDDDEAGQKAALKYISEFMTSGFTVYITLLDGLDPDDFVREKADLIEDTESSLEKILDDPKYKVHGFKFLMQKFIDTSDEFTLNESARSLTKIIAAIPDDGQKDIYMAWLSKESKIRESQVKSWVQNFTEINHASEYEKRKYTFPEGLNVKLEDVQDTIERYGLFIHSDRIWMLEGTKESGYYFSDVSNFSIEIIQHMQDEKMPMKLVKIRNIHGEERIFDVPSEKLNKPQDFDTQMTNHGNFFYTGGRNEFQKLRRYLMDRMGVGTKIEVMGWQPQNFWAWNNYITIPGEGNIQIDENGVYKKDSTSYYIPSANQIYEHNSFKFTPQKKCVLLRSDIAFSDYASQMIKVHRDHAITAILFTVATVYLDIVEDQLGNFPLLFLYGPASTGKDQLIECCQSFFGKPQSPIHIGNKVSTQKAQVRKFAQFRNVLVHLSEYRPGDQQLDELLKGFWDRRGYERGTIDSAYGTETVPVTSSVIFTGNHYPDDDALITRIIAEEMTKTDFSMEEKRDYQKLKDMTKKGISYVVADLLQHRPMIEEKFKEQFRKVEKELKSNLAISDLQERMIGNVSILATFYELLKDKVMFPFKYAEYSSHISQGLQAQARKLNTASISMKWWDCFLACIRTKNDTLIHGKEFEVKDNKLFFNFTHTYNRVAMQWWAQYHEQAPTKSRITDMIKKDFSYEHMKDSHRMESGRTSVWVLNAQQMNIYDELIDAVEWQQKEGKDMPEKREPNNPYDQNNNNQTSLLPSNDEPF